MIEILFWFFLSTIFYCYFGYPAGLWVLSRFFTRPVAKKDYTPFVSVVTSIHNEEDVIESKIENLFNASYPQDKLEILIGSDGSTDRTNEIIRSFKDSRIRFFENSGRSGKMVMINELVKKSRGEIIVFSDARQMFVHSAIAELANNFADPTIGSVSGELVFDHKDKEGGTARGVGLYWHYEKFIRFCESRIHSMLGATGAIYAIRRDLYTEAPGDIVLDDMFIPLKIVEKGFRAIFDDKAKAMDDVADSPREESRRKTRTLYGNYQIFGALKNLFNPFNSPVAIQFFSHKFLRVIAPFILIALFIMNLFLIIDPFYRIMMVLQVTFYLMGLGGFLTRYCKTGFLKVISNICYAPYVFCLLNFSALIGFINFVFSRQQVTWEKAREAEKSVKD